MQSIIHPMRTFSPSTHAPHFQATVCLQWTTHTIHKVASSKYCPPIPSRVLPTRDYAPNAQGSTPQTFSTNSKASYAHKRSCIQCTRFCPADIVRKFQARLRLQTLLHTTQTSFFLADIAQPFPSEFYQLGTLHPMQKVLPSRRCPQITSQVLPTRVYASNQRTRFLFADIVRQIQGSFRPP